MALRDRSPQCFQDFVQVPAELQSDPERGFGDCVCSQEVFPVFVWSKVHPGY